MSTKTKSKRKRQKQKALAEDGEFEIISEAQKQIDEKNWVGEGDASRAKAVKEAEKMKQSLALKNPDGSKHKMFLLHWNGRFGNRMHQYAYGASYAKNNDIDFYLPSEWEGTKLFKNQHHKVIDDDELRLYLNQTMKQFDNLDARMKALQAYTDRTGMPFSYVNVDKPDQNWKKQGNVCIDSVCAYHKSIFKNMSKDFLLKDVFQFSDEVKNLDIYKKLEDKQGTYDIAHLRRDDISNVNYKQNGGYSVVSKDSYIKAFKKYGYDKNEMEWTSDDWTGNWGVTKPSQRFGWKYPEGSVYKEGIMFDWLPDFLRLYFARTIFRANSSFSWWTGFLSQQRDSPAKVFSPRLDKRILYAAKETYEQEGDFDFEEGNHPHWLCIYKKDNCDDIIIE